MHPVKVIIFLLIMVCSVLYVLDGVVEVMQANESRQLGKIP